MDNSKDTFEKLCDMLGYSDSKGLITSNTTNGDLIQIKKFEYIREKLNIDAAFFIPSPTGTYNVPLIYFHRLEAYNSKEIANLHKLAWNIGEAPLLIIVLPGQILVYNTYEPPRITEQGLEDKAGLIEILSLVSSLESERRRILEYHRSELESGNYWKKSSNRFKVTSRVDNTLLSNLKSMRGRILKEIPDQEIDIDSVEIVHSLMGRAIFVRYLEDRKDKRGHCAFPSGFFSQFSSGAECFADLLNDKSATYALFEYLYKKFNGDIFPVSEREKVLINEKHLNVLRAFIIGDSNIVTGQMALWPLYSFDVIPIQLISYIYEQFFHKKKDVEALINNHKKNSGKAGTHYTPFHLVEFLMDEVFPWHGEYTPIKILDPACGSGVFLVEAYRRLIARWMSSNKNKRPTVADLRNILTNSIFGVDTNSESIRVAAFSLCLTLCDYLEPRYIWDQVKFPSLREKNLFITDFFSESCVILNQQYDLIIGNPPWEGSLSKDAIIYLERANRVTANSQIALAFLWRASDLCKIDGEICLLITSKGLLFNRSQKNQRFRREFFASIHVKTIINFSSLRRSLFNKAIGPAAAIFYSPDKANYEIPIIYCSPKPVHTLQDSWQFIIESNDISRLPRMESINNDLIWKAAMWGGPRDYQLIKRLSKLPTLKDICIKNNWTFSEGFNVGSRKDKVPELTGKPYVDVTALKRFRINESDLPPLTETHFHRHVSTKREVFQGPHILIKQSPVAGFGFVVALLDDEAVFGHSILGIHGPKKDIDKLSLYCLILNSRLMLYWALITSGRLLIERDEAEAGEILNFPMPSLENCAKVLGADFSLDNFIKTSKQHQESFINNLISRLYGLTRAEESLINDTLKYTYDYYRFGGKSVAAEPTDEKDIENYLVSIKGILKESFIDKHFDVSMFVGTAPLQVVSLTLTEEHNNKIKKIKSEEKLMKTLSFLDKCLLEEQSQGVFVRRNIRVYNEDTIYIVKPNQKKYWTLSSSFREADEIYAEIMDSWRCQQ